MLCEVFVTQIMYSNNIDDSTFWLFLIALVRPALHTLACHAFAGGKHAVELTATCLGKARYSQPRLRPLNVTGGRGESENGC